MDLTSLLVATLASFVIGGLWYSPFLFGRAWKRLAGVEGGMSWKTAIVGFAIEAVRAYVMAIIVASMGAFSLATGMEAGFWIWLGFVATVGAMELLYERRSWKLLAISFGYHLVALMAMGAILATW